MQFTRPLGDAQRLINVGLGQLVRLLRYLV
jgi:hypothetical protein